MWGTWSLKEAFDPAKKEHPDPDFLQLEDTIMIDDTDSETYLHMYDKVMYHHPQNIFSMGFFLQWIGTVDNPYEKVSVCCLDTLSINPFDLDPKNTKLDLKTMGEVSVAFHGCNS